jgi:hypothetical protein
VASRPFSETTQAEIDREVSRLLREAEAQAVDLLKGHESQLDQLANLLLEQETVGGETVYELVGLKPPERIDDASTVAPRRPVTPAGQQASDGQAVDGQHVATTSGSAADQPGTAAD